MRASDSAHRNKPAAEQESSLPVYARFGVKEYWIGDPANKALENLMLKEGRYELHCCAEERGKLVSLLLAGLEFDLSEIQ